jgi:hypothetical protein
MRWSFFLVTVFLASPRFAAPQTHYQIPLWQRIKRALQAPDGLEYFRSSFQGATIPGGVDGLAGLQGTVISREPPDHPTILTVSMSDNGIADVTLRLIDDSRPAPQPELPQARVPPEPVSSPIGRHDITVEDMIREWRVHGLHTGWLSGPQVQQSPPMPAVDLAPGATIGATIEFEGIASEFSREPFMVTFDAPRSKVRTVQAKE